MSLYRGRGRGKPVGSRRPDVNKEEHAETQPEEESAPSAEESVKTEKYVPPPLRDREGKKETKKMEKKEGPKDKNKDNTLKQPSRSFGDAGFKLNLANDPMNMKGFDDVECLIPRPIVGHHSISSSQIGVIDLAKAIYNAAPIFTQHISEAAFLYYVEVMLRYSNSKYRVLTGVSNESDDQLVAYMESNTWYVPDALERAIRITGDFEDAACGKVVYNPPPRYTLNRDWGRARTSPIYQN